MKLSPVISLAAPRRSAPRRSAAGAEAVGGHATTRQTTQPTQRRELHGECEQGMGISTLSS